MTTEIFKKETNNQMVLAFDCVSPDEVVKILECLWNEKMDEVIDILQCEIQYCYGVTSTNHQYVRESVVFVEMPDLGDDKDILEANETALKLFRAKILELTGIKEEE